MIWRVPCKIYPDFYRVHPDFSRVPPRPDFSRVLTWFFSDLQVWNPAFFKLPPWKKPGRSYSKKISDSTLEKSGHGGTLEKSGCRLKGQMSCWILSPFLSEAVVDVTFWKTGWWLSNFQTSWSHYGPSFKKIINSSTPQSHLVDFSMIHPVLRLSTANNKSYFLKEMHKSYVRFYFSLINCLWFPIALGHNCSWIYYCNDVSTHKTAIWSSTPFILVNLTKSIHFSIAKVLIFDKLGYAMSNLHTLRCRCHLLSQNSSIIFMKCLRVLMEIANDNKA